MELQELDYIEKRIDEPWSMAGIRMGYLRTNLLLIIGEMRRLLKNKPETSPPTLPPVSPEYLVEGEWYYCVKRDWQGFGKAANDSWCNKPTGTMAIWIGDTDWSPQCFDSIYVPLKFKIGGAK